MLFFWVKWISENYWTWADDTLHFSPDVEHCVKCPDHQNANNERTHSLQKTHWGWLWSAQLFASLSSLLLFLGSLWSTKTLPPSRPINGSSATSRSSPLPCVSYAPCSSSFIPTQPSASSDKSHLELFLQWLCPLFWPKQSLWFWNSRSLL